MGMNGNLPILRKPLTLATRIGKYIHTWILGDRHGPEFCLARPTSNLSSGWGNRNPIVV